MAKKWKTLRKTDSPQPEEGEEVDNGKAAPLKTPRRRLLARNQANAEPQVEEPAAEPPADLPKPVSAPVHVRELDPEPDPEPMPVRPLDVVEPRILVVHDVAATYRLVEETFGNFTTAKVDSTPDVLTAFELAIRRDYQLFILALTLPGMSGSLFYEMVARGYSSGLGKKKLAPAVVFIREEGDPQPANDLIRDVRVKAVWTKPLNIERMLDSVSTVIKRKNPAR